ncbi:MAG: hypothetical protein R2827_13120 [Bdellovibrionales bacterium]
MKSKFFIVSLCILAAVSSSFILVDMFWEGPSFQKSTAPQSVPAVQSQHSANVIGGPGVLSTSEMTEAISPVNPDDELMAIQEDENKPRVSKIQNLVTAAIGHDRQKLESLRTKKQKLKVLLERINDESQYLSGRLKKLDSIANVLVDDDIKREEEIMPESNASQTMAAIESYNRIFSKDMVKYVDRGEESEIKLTGSSLLLIDSKRLRGARTVLID